MTSLDAGKELHHGGLCLIIIRNELSPDHFASLLVTTLFVLVSPFVEVWHKIGMACCAKVSPNNGRNGFLTAQKQYKIVRNVRPILSLHNDTKFVVTSLTTAWQYISALSPYTYTGLAHRKPKKSPYTYTGLALKGLRRHTPMSRPKNRDFGIIWDNYGIVQLTLCRNLPCH